MDYNMRKLSKLYRLSNRITLSKNLLYLYTLCGIIYYYYFNLRLYTLLHLRCTSTVIEFLSEMI